MNTYAKKGEGGTHPESAHSGKPTTLGIYIQVPFCQTKCTYCNFHTGVVSADRYEPYAKAISREVEPSGHGFSRAVNAGHGPGVLTPEGCDATVGSSSVAAAFRTAELAGGGVKPPRRRAYTERGF